MPLLPSHLPALLAACATLASLQAACDGGHAEDLADKDAPASLPASDDGGYASRTQAGESSDEGDLDGRAPNAAQEAAPNAVPDAARDAAPPAATCPPGQMGTPPVCVTPPGGRSCPPYPAFPNAQCTGVPVGVMLTASGSINVTISGTVIDSRDVSGTISINANNVTVRRTRIRSTAFAPIRIADNVTGARIEDSEVDGMTGGDNTNGVLGPATIVRCDIHGVENGITPGSGSVIEDTYIHDMHAIASPHYDGIQVDGGLKNIVIRHNSITCPPGQTSALMLDNCFGGIDGVLVTQNYLAGGGFTLYHAANFPNHYDRSCAGQAHLINVSITSNHFGSNAYGYGLLCRDLPAAWSGNVNASSGAPIPRPGLDVPAANCPFND